MITQTRSRMFWPFALMAALLGVILFYAAVAEDAYVTFRVVHNAVNGYGLRWNVEERVQAYTNPLWMLLHIPFVMVWDVYYVTLVLGIVSTLAAVGLTMYAFPRPAPVMLALLFMPLMISRSFADYATSGLENSLNYTLFALFGWALFRGQSKYFWFFVSLFCALSMVNRLDTAILYAPVMLYLLASRWRVVSFKQCLAGGMPIIAWELFSLFYYGFLFPNTKYAKLNSSIPFTEYLTHGFQYFLNLIAMDVTSAVWLIAASIILPLYIFSRPRNKDTLSPLFAWIGVGIACYTFYVISVGGQHVSGRFWSTHVFASVWLIYVAFGSVRLSSKAWLIFAACLLAIKTAYPDREYLRQQCRRCFAGDIRETGMRITLSDHLFNDAQIPMLKNNKRQKISRSSVAGFYGYRSGPTVRIVDAYGLGDALIARLPSKKQTIGRIGHIGHIIPVGYIEALKTGSTDNMHPDLAEYYRKLSLIISGDLWSRERLIEIIKFNTGAYDHLMKNYINSLKLDMVTENEQ